MIFPDFHRPTLRVLTIVGLLIVAPVAVLSVARAQVGSDAPPAPVALKGPFMISADQNIVWRVDQATGAVSYCIRDTVTNDPALLAQRPPVCSAWSR